MFSWNKSACWSFVQYILLVWAMNTMTLARHHPKNANSAWQKIKRVWELLLTWGRVTDVRLRQVKTISNFPWLGVAWQCAQQLVAIQVAPWCGLVDRLCAGYGSATPGPNSFKYRAFPQSAVEPVVVEPSNKRCIRAATRRHHKASRQFGKVVPMRETRENAWFLHCLALDC